MSWVAAGIASGMATMAGVQYIKGKRDQKKDEKNRPKYEIPEEVKQNLSAAQQDALQGLPEEQRQMFLSNLERGTAMGLNASATRRGGLAGVAALNQNQNDAYGQLLSMDAAARMQNKGALMQQRQNMADYKDQAFQFNTVDPYYEGIARKQARTAALFQNLNNAASMGMGGMGSMGGKQASTGTVSSMPPPSTLGKKFTIDQSSQPGYNPNTGLVNPYMDNQVSNPYGGTMNTDTGLTNPYRKTQNNNYW